MSRYQCLSTTSACPPLPSSLPRVKSTTDLTRLCHSSRYSISDAATRKLGENVSENSQVLYMESGKQNKRTRRSLGSTDNSCLEIINLLGAEFENSDAKEDISWNIIDQEIWEWQYTCETGQPYWYSEESRYHRSRNMVPIRDREKHSMWSHEPDLFQQAERFDRRGTVSESSLSRGIDSHELAHKIAIQLLGSCFTLAPDDSVAMSSPDYTSLDHSGRIILPESGMISSLRLHGHFRYSPCFGHEPRSSSPVHMWPGVRDRSCSLAGMQGKLDSTTKSRRRKARRNSKHPQSAKTEMAFESANRHGLYKDSHEQDPESCINEARQRESHLQGHIRDYKCPRLVGHFIVEDTPGNSLESTIRPNAADVDALKRNIHENRSAKVLHPESSNHHLQPVLRSEPHQVFVHPVKELAVKRWRSIRRFSGSLQSALWSGSEDNVSDASSYASGSILSSSAVARRRRARERGEIHSSADSIQHNNSFASESNAKEVVETLIATDKAGSPTKSLDKVTNTSLLLARPLVVLRRSLSLNSWALTRPVFLSSSINTGNNSSTLDGHSKTLQAHPGFSHYPTRISRSRGRRSLLSEVCTPEDLSMGANTVMRRELDIRTMASVDRKKRATTEQPCSNSDFSSNHTGLPVSSLDTTEMERETAVVALKHPLRRMSTSGTQIFIPDLEGIEVDGLPVGPSKEMWISGGESKQATYL
ncbi:hypothetical protein BJ875DRAFT_529446 [Amylocarpus encephaloides]|uniref:Uncharacterized protein n=1 Tax=Amylocarpus encephaloides TaxID=45428 RepID=A0A9P8C630_9HELO|nr:hypothetical protein BJ875DRAFT_529446 [Amylocarpus encephaloides]